MNCSFVFVSSDGSSCYSILFEAVNIIQGGEGGGQNDLPDAESDNNNNNDNTNSRRCGVSSLAIIQTSRGGAG